LQDDNTQIVIYGIDGHAEVKGLLGQTKNKAIVVTTEQDLDKIDFYKPIVVFSQTTKSTEKYYAICDLIVERAMKKGNTDVTAHDTICRQVSNRAPHLEKFAARYDVIIFVSGHKSSNGKVLHQVCKLVNERSYFVSGPEDIDINWFTGASSIGVSGATSTPMWLINDVVKHIRDSIADEA
jgi:4-hydroxy-3-methylbut-2-enyl diphosphate reductase